ncbi:hypothetical protein L6V77_29295 [Myxococcota bacterium]|nr:hypothetical protein [Myxococcota bacterium]
MMTPALALFVSFLAPASPPEAPARTRARLVEAQAAFEAGRYLEAHALYREIARLLANEPPPGAVSWAAEYFAAESARRLGQTDAAAQALDALLERPVPPALATHAQAARAHLQLLSAPREPSSVSVPLVERRPTPTPEALRPRPAVDALPRESPPVPAAAADQTWAYLGLGAAVVASGAAIALRLSAGEHSERRNRALERAQRAALDRNIAALDAAWAEARAEHRTLEWQSGAMWGAAAVAAVAGAWTVRSFWVAASASGATDTTNTLDAMSMTWSF